MHVGNPIQGLFPGVDADVLRVLCNVTEPQSGRQVARASKRSHTAAIRVLDRLAGEGIVKRVVTTHAALYSLNREHLAAWAIEALARLRQEMFDAMTEEIEKWSIKPIHASVFGSAARGDGDETSDIDVLLVRKSLTDIEQEQWDSQIEAFRNSVFEMTGNHLGLSDLALIDVEGVADLDVSAWREIREDEIHLYGKSLRSLTRRTR